MKNDMDWKNDPEQLINMLQTMVLWIDNDYEDEDLKGRVREIHKYLERLEYMCEIEKDKISLLKQWRDWNWHMYLYHGNQIVAAAHKESAEDFHKAYRIMIGNLQSAPTNMTGYENIKYGEYPEEN